MVVEENTIFGIDNLNIFTDASVKKEINGSTTACSGYIALYRNYDSGLAEQDCQILFNSTNNQAEIYAIYMGIRAAVNIKNSGVIINNINLFSDSKISVYGLRNWIVSWVEQSKGYELFSSSGLPVSNQSIFLSCIYMILRNHLNINIYHIHGHKNPKYKEQVELFMRDFEKFNNINISYPLAQSLMRENDNIDNYTRKMLTIQGITGFCYDDMLMKNIYNPHIFNIDEYLKLIGASKYN